MKRYVGIMLAVLSLTVACRRSEEKQAAADTAAVEDEMYDLYDEPSATPPEVAAWLQSVGIDSAERALSRHNGVVELEDTTLYFWFKDLLRCYADKAMDYPFEELAESMEMTIQRSDDGRLRVFFWNTGLGGTCPDIARYTLLKGDDGHVHLLEDGHDSPQLLDLYQLKSKRGETVYLMHEYYREWSSYGAAWVWGCRIKADGLDTLALFPHGETSVGVEYGIPGWYFAAGDGEGWGWLFELHGGDLYVPVVVEDGITDRYDLYRWNGQRLDSIGNVGNRRLHQSLQQYDELCHYFVTKGFRVRVDMMGDGSYRYASWPRSKETSAKPDIVIMGGRYDEQNGCYIFENDGYTYRVGDISYAYGGGGHRGLSVEKDGKVLLHQEKE